MYGCLVAVFLFCGIGAVPIDIDLKVPISGTAELNGTKLKQYIDERIAEEIKEIFNPDLECPDGWLEFEESCFLLSDSKKSWADAQYECQLDGGRLAEPKSEAEIEFLKEKARMEGNTFWLGGTDVDNEGEWVWESTGGEITVTDWHTTTIVEPNNALGVENCLSMNKNLLFEWNDENCDNLNRYVCEERSKK